MTYNFFLVLCGVIILIIEALRAIVNFEFNPEEAKKERGEKIKPKEGKKGQSKKTKRTAIRSFTSRYKIRINNYAPVLVCLAVFASLYIQILKENQKDAEEAYTGLLKSKRKLILSSGEKFYPTLQVGNTNMILRNIGEIPNPDLVLLENTKLSIWLVDGKIKVSTTIRNQVGEVIAILVENEWQVKKEKALDRNYTQDALEVINELGDVIMQIQLLPDRVRFQGILYDTAGNRLAFYIDNNGDGIMTFSGNYPMLQGRVDIARKFKYPSQGHLGELIE